jgi:hypothetical protein
MMKLFEVSDSCHRQFGTPHYVSGVAKRYIKYILSMLETWKPSSGLWTERLDAKLHL